MSIDVEVARAATPGCAEVIHLNNAGASLVSRNVLARVIAHLEREATIGGYEAEAEAAPDLAGTLAAGERLLGAAPGEVAFTTNASEAWWRAFMAVPLRAGDRVLTGRSEYVGNAYGLLQARHRGVQVELVPDDPTGQVDCEALERMLDDRVRLVAMTQVPTSGGLVNPVAEVGALCRANGSLFLLDACQAAGQIPLDVGQIGCDFLALTGRKFLRGPRGTGLLWVRSSVLADLEDPIFIDSHSAQWTSEWEYVLAPDARRFELFESAVAARLGLGVAIDEALALGIDEIEARVVGLAVRLRGLLGEIPGVTVRDQGVRRCAIVTFTVADVPSAAVASALRQERINTSVSPVTAAQFDLAHRGIEDMVRASVHYFNTDDELDTMVDVLRKLTARD